jgi:hypothetical protein
MISRLTVRLTDVLLAWLKETSRCTGMPVPQVILRQLQNSKSSGGKRRFLRHVGAMSGGPPDLSSRKGFSRL